MATADVFQEIVKNALIKDGWTITDDACLIKYQELGLHTDWGAERTIAAEHVGQKIFVEVNSALNTSPLEDLQMAVGQFKIDQTPVRLSAAERKVYLAIGEHGNDFLELNVINPFVQ